MMFADSSLTVIMIFLFISIKEIVKLNSSNIYDNFIYNRRMK